MSHAIGLGKLILLGEHAVVYGYPALAAALDRGVRVAAVPTPAGGDLRVEVASWNLKLAADDDHPFARGLAAIADALELGRPSVTLVGDAQIVPGAGLGASAAFAVAIARALLTHAGGPTDPTTVARAASASEDVVHGNSSGVDVALAIAGGVGVFRKRSGLRPFACGPLRVLVGPSGAPRATRDMIERVASATGSAAEDARLRELGALCDTGAAALAGGKLAELGATMDQAQIVLGRLGVSTPLLDGLCALARKRGAWGAKLTGAGGGGAVLAIAPRECEDAVLAAWKTLGVAGFIATVGGR
jgi:mevalonate kinase